VEETYRGAEKIREIIRITGPEGSAFERGKCRGMVHSKNNWGLGKERRDGGKEVGVRSSKNCLRKKG